MPIPTWLEPFALILATLTLSWLPQAGSQRLRSEEYDPSKQVRVTGMLVGSASPDAPYSVYLLVTGTDAKGNEQPWAIEGDPANELRNRGHKDDSLKMGEVITVVGHPVRAGKRPEDRMPKPLRGAIQRAFALAEEGRLILGTEITRPDGTKIPFGHLK